MKDEKLNQAIESAPLQETKNKKFHQTKIVVDEKLFHQIKYNPYSMSMSTFINLAIRNLLNKGL